MKKIYLLLFSCILLTQQNNYAQSYDTTSYYGKMNYIFNNIDKSQISTGLLREYGIDFQNPDNFTGSVLHDSNWVNLTDWRVLYATLYSEQINGNASLLYLDTVNNLISQYAQNNLPATFVCLYYNYQYLDTNAINNHLFTISDGQLNDVAGRSQSPYDTHSVFAIAPTQQFMFTGSNTLIFHPELFLSNTGKTISTLQIDPSGIGTYQTVSFNTPFTVNYTDTGLYTVNFKIIYTDNTVMYSHTKFIVYQRNNQVVFNNKRYSDDLKGYGPPYENEAFEYGYYPNEVVDFTADKAYLSVQAKGDYTVVFSVNNSTGQIRKPLIVVEGFDPYAIGGDYDGNYYSAELSILDRVNHDINTKPVQATTFNYGLDDINSYDLIYLHWHNGTDYIQRNAYLLEKLIQTVNSIKIPFNGVMQQNVIIGESMGGLVARYALRDMEINNVPHNTRLFLSHDAPHWGANVPVAYQALVQYIAPWKMINAGFQGSFPYFYIQWKDMFPDAVNGMDIFNSPAAKQMLIQRYTLNSDNNPVWGSTGYSLTADNSTHTNFLNELNSMGMPVNCKNIAISDGACNGSLTFADNSELFNLTGNTTLGSYWGNLWKSLLYALGGAFNSGFIPTLGTVPTNNLSMLMQLPLSIVTKKGNTIADWGAWAIPASGTSQIFRGDMYVHRELFWGLFTNNSYFLKCHINSSTDMLPLDNAPGGKYDLTAFGINADSINKQLAANKLTDWMRAKILQPQFCFVPTVSALNISNPATNLRASLCNNIACLTNFNDYYVSTSNLLHTSYTQDIANFILQRQDANFSCALVCPTSLSVSGDNSVCTTSNPYTISNLPTGATVTWSATPSNIVTINSPNSPQTTLTKIANGQITLTATINNVCGTTPVILTSNSIRVGTPTIYGTYTNTYNGYGSTNGLGEYPYFVNSACTGYSIITNMQVTGGNSVTWSKVRSSGVVAWSNISPYGISFYLYANGETAVFRIDATNNCGTTSKEFAWQASNCSSNPGGCDVVTYTASPNPVSSSLIIVPDITAPCPPQPIGTENENSDSARLQLSTMATTNKAKTLTTAKEDKAVIKFIQIFDETGKMCKRLQYAAAKQAVVDVSGLSNGIYFISISNGEKTEYKKIIVQH